MRPDLRLVGADGKDPARRTRIRTLLADDHAAIRTRISRLLQSDPGVELTGEADSLAATIAAVAHQRPDVLVLDLHMLGSDVLGSLKRLRELAPGSELIVLTMDARAAVAAQVLDAGALGYVLKEHADADLPAALRRVVGGERFVTAQVRERLVLFDNARGPGGLTRRETRVLRLIALGFTTAETARQLHLSVRHTEATRAAVYDKLAVHTRAELVAYALEHGLLAG